MATAIRPAAPRPRAAPRAAQLEPHGVHRLRARHQHPDHRAREEHDPGGLVESISGIIPERRLRVTIERDAWFDEQYVPTWRRATSTYCYDRHLRVRLHPRDVQAGGRTPLGLLRAAGARRGPAGGQADATADVKAGVLRVMRCTRTSRGPPTDAPRSTPRSTTWRSGRAPPDPAVAGQARVAGSAPDPAGAPDGSVLADDGDRARRDDDRPRCRLVADELVARSPRP